MCSMAAQDRNILQLPQGVDWTSLPENRTGPVGPPVGEPPAGSRLTANVAFMNMSESGPGDMGIGFMSPSSYVPSDLGLGS